MDFLSLAALPKHDTARSRLSEVNRWARPWCVAGASLGAPQRQMCRALCAHFAWRSRRPHVHDWRLCISPGRFPVAGPAALRAGAFASGSAAAPSPLCALVRRVGLGETPPRHMFGGRKPVARPLQTAHVLDLSLHLVGPSHRWNRVAPTGRPPDRPTDQPTGRARRRTDRAPHRAADGPDARPRSRLFGHLADQPTACATGGPTACPHTMGSRAVSDVCRRLRRGRSCWAMRAHAREVMRLHEWWDFATGASGADGSAAPRKKRKKDRARARVCGSWAGSRRRSFVRGRWSQLTLWGLRAAGLSAWLHFEPQAAWARRQLVMGCSGLIYDGWLLARASERCFNTGGSTCDVPEDLFV